MNNEGIDDNQIGKLCLSSLGVCHFVGHDWYIIIKAVSLNQDCWYSSRSLSTPVDFTLFAECNLVTSQAFPPKNCKCNLQHGTLTNLNPGRGHYLFDSYPRSCISPALVGASDIFLPSDL